MVAVEDKRARGKFKEWRDTMADRPRTADYAWTVLARVLSVAKDRGAIAINVCERGGRLYETDQTEIIWTADHIKKFCAVASDELQFALLLALWTGQRQGDLIRLTWMQYDGSKIRVKQGKGKKRVVIPVGAPLKAALDSRRPEKPKGQSCETPLASRGPATVSGHRGTRRSSAPGSVTGTCTPRPARHSGHAAGARGVHGGRDRNYHRPLAAQRALDPGCTLPRARSRAR